MKLTVIVCSFKKKECQWSFLFLSNQNHNNNRNFILKRFFRFLAESAWDCRKEIALMPVQKLNNYTIFYFDLKYHKTYLYHHKIDLRVPFMLLKPLICHLKPSKTLENLRFVPNSKWFWLNIIFFSTIRPISRNLPTKTVHQTRNKANSLSKTLSKSMIRAWKPRNIDLIHSVKFWTLSLVPLADLCWPLFSAV